MICRVCVARSGLAVIELLVVVSVIGLLASLSLSAIQRAREASRRIECVNRLRALGAAMHAFETARGRFPCVPADQPNPVFRNPKFPPPPTVSFDQFVQPTSAQHQLLPYLGLAVLAESIDSVADFWKLAEEPPESSKNQALMNIVIEVLRCPSDRPAPGATSYLYNAGTSAQVAESVGIQPPSAALRGFGVSALGVPAAAVVDGLSNTVAFSERLFGDQDPTTFTTYRDIGIAVYELTILPDRVAARCREMPVPPMRHASYAGVGWFIPIFGATLYNHILTPNSETPDCVVGFGLGGPGAYTARSLHAGGVNALLGDGAVKFVADGVDLIVWRAVGTIAGRENVSNF